VNINLYISLTLSGLLALVLSEVVTFPVSATRTGLAWFGYGMWAVAAVMLVCALIRERQKRRIRKTTEARHEV